MRRLSAATLSLLALVTVASIPAGASAATIAVTSTANAGAGSLRAAIERADETPGADEIQLAVAGAISLTGELPPLKGQLAIAGAGPETVTVTRSAAAPNGFSIFTVFPNSTVQISNLRVTGGEAPTGGGIRNLGQLSLNAVYVSNNVATDSGGNEAMASGGGIWSSGPLILRQVLVQRNSALAAAGSTVTEARGGGVAALGSTTVWRSTIAENIAEANASQGIVRAAGGGITIEGGGNEAIELSTISGNTARAGGAKATEAAGGGILGEPGLPISGSTIVGNTLSAGTARSANVEAVAAMIRDSIVARPGGGSSCGAALSSSGFNVDEDGSCGLRSATDHWNVAPGLAPSLAENGGLTPTFALEPSGIAIDQGKAFAATTDQRGEPRPHQAKGAADAPGGDGSDIGSYEYEGATDTTPPQTLLDVKPPKRSASPKAYLVFHALEMGARFQCKLDGGGYKPCKAPFRARVASGPHTFAVRATDRAGNVDRSPARWRFSAG